MSVQPIPLSFPLGGIVNSTAASVQPEGTTTDALNVRPKASANGRLTGGRRPGLTRVSAARVNGANPVRRLITTMRQDPRVTFSGVTNGVVTDELKLALPLRTPIYGGATDAQGNLYVIDGLATLVKLSPDLSTVWTKALPTANQAQRARAIAVDGFGTVFAAVSDGGRDDLAKLWAIQQTEDNGAEILWSIDTSAFVETMAVYRQRLVTLQSKPSTGQAWIVAYDAIASTYPVEAFRALAPAFPNGMAIGPKGKIAVVAESVYPKPRGYDPRLPAGKITVDWKLSDLVDIDTRIWSEYDPESLLDLNLEDGEEATSWPETYNGRDFVQKVASGAPTFIRTSLGRLPALQFSGSTVSPTQVLTTGPNGSIQPGFDTQQRTAWPAYQDSARTAGYTNNAQTVVFLLVRPERTAIGAKGMLLFKQTCDEAGAAAVAHHIAFNCDSSAATLAGATTPGAVKYWLGKVDGTGGVNILNGGGVGPTVQSGTWTETISNAVLITLVLNHGTTGVATDHPSVLRVNGAVVDQFDLKNGANSILAGTFGVSELGSLTAVAALESFRGTVHYMAVLNRYASLPNNAPIRYPTVGAFAGITDNGGDSELERIEGAIMNRFGCAHALAAAHPFSDAKGPPNKDGITSHSLPWLLNSSHQVLAVYSAAGDLQSVATSYAAYRAFPPQTIGGIGYGVAGDSDGSWYTMGAHARAASGAPADDYTTLRKVLDTGASLTWIANITGATASSPTPSSATGAWSKTYNDYSEQVGVANLDISGGWHYPRCACDAFDVVYFPWSATLGFVGVACLAYDKTGGLGFPNNRAITGNNGMTLPWAQRGYAALPDPNVPAYVKVAGVPTLSGANEATKARAEWVTILGTTGTGGAGTANETVHRVHMISVARTAGSPRAFKRLAVSNGAIKVSSDAYVSLASPAGSGTLAQPELSTAASFVSAAALFGRIFLTDGVRDVVYTAEDDTAKEWRATAGRMLPRVKLLAAWRASIVRARSADNGHTWQISKVGDPFDYDIDPAVVSPAQAVSAEANPRAGYCPDIITGLAPVNDDLLVFLADHTCYRMTGHPMEGGVFDTLSTVVGGVFGKAHATDGAATLFWLTNRMSIAMSVGGGEPVPISDASIEYRLRTIDLANYNVELLWNPEEQGLHVFQLPTGAGGALVRAWFWHQPTNSWWEDAFGYANAGVQPSAVDVIDSDAAGDRRIILAGEDGWVRALSASAEKDDATNAGANVPIDSYVTLGPLLRASPIRQRLVKLEVELASDLSGARAEIIATDSADSLGSPVVHVELGPGLNPPRHVRSAGGYIFIRLRSGEIGPGWAFEGGRAYLAPTGRKRVRG